MFKEGAGERGTTSEKKKCETSVTQQDLSNALYLLYVLTLFFCARRDERWTDMFFSQDLVMTQPRLDELVS